jgi:membrane-associated phospholipid phosphatase
LKRHLLQIAVVLAFVVVWIVIYDATNRFGMTSPRTMSFVPPTLEYPWLFQSWTGIVYLFGGFLCLLLPFFWNWGRKNFSRLMTAQAIASGIAFLAYVIFPLKIARSDFQGPGFGSQIMRLFTSWDGPANCFPSFHAIFAVLGALFITCHPLPKPQKIFIWILAVSVCGSTLTVGQHYFIDVPAGIITAIFAFYVSRRLFDGWESEQKRRAGC